MCGIVGYLGTQQAAPIILKGLQRLEYRGYDSAGMVLYDNAHFQLFKTKGKVHDLRQLTNFDATTQTIGLGHTRWATHGVPSDANAHPHYSNSGELALIHNGIIENYESIKKVASGGELSRLMLCIKSLVAEYIDLPTMIFDEIDSGISGEVSLKVGEIMKQLSRNHQLISITHLPQIARTADKHLYIYKETNGNRTNTRIKELKGEDRVIELAKMLSGDKLSDAALANAREMIVG